MSLSSPASSFSSANASTPLAPLSLLDPLHGFRYMVVMESLFVGGFSKVRGLARETKVETYREGGVNDYEHKLASLTTYGNLVLEAGLALPLLWSWHDDVVAGKIKRRKISILLQDKIGVPTWIWHVDGAFPVKWSVSDLDAGSSGVAIESVEFAHHGLRLG